MKSPELLLPVGNMSMALAAIHGGADAIYVGVPGFNARGRSYDFSMEELKELIDLCHLYGVKVHLAFNILIFQDELTLAQKVLEEIIPMGPDAFIVQDLGLARLIRKMCPEIRIHGSTQMTVTTDDAIHLLEDLNIQRFVLGRENSLSEMRLIRGNTKRELEVFVHGALCVAYSGQCFTSESLGGRSANRGQCAQSCRLSYEMFVDSEKRDLGDKKFLVSPQDLCGVNEVGELIAAGIDSFKVEGRLKGPEYVMTAATTYREAIQGRVMGCIREGVGWDARRYALRFAPKLLKSRRKGANHAGVGCKPSANLRGIGLQLSN
jgi:putative protease